ncbi:MAG: hypothetical protein ABEJ93_04390 [Candidatus Nanohalobium sp.]
MEKEYKDLLVSGLMFLVAVQSFRLLNYLGGGKMLGVCDPSLRFANALVAGVLVAGVILSASISFVYFKDYTQEICKPVIDRGES